MLVKRVILIFIALVVFLSFLQSITLITITGQAGANVQTQYGTVSVSVKRFVCNLTLSTDQIIYQQFENVLITGTGYGQNNNVSLTIKDQYGNTAPGFPTTIQSTNNETINYTWNTGQACDGNYTVYTNAIVNTKFKCSANTTFRIDSPAVLNLTKAERREVCTHEFIEDVLPEVKYLDNTTTQFNSTQLLHLEFSRNLTLTDLLAIFAKDLDTPCDCAFEDCGGVNCTVLSPGYWKTHVCCENCDGQPEPNCAECDGKVTNLTLQYNGTSSATIKVVQKNGDTVFEDTVAPHGEFSFLGTDKGTLGTEIKIYINNVENTKIHTSCSQPIAPGMVFGDFEIIAGASKNGGPLCPAAGFDSCSENCLPDQVLDQYLAKIRNISQHFSNLTTREEACEFLSTNNPQKSRAEKFFLANLFNYAAGYLPLFIPVDSVYSTATSFAGAVQDSDNVLVNLLTSQYERIGNLHEDIIEGNATTCTTEDEPEEPCSGCNGNQSCGECDGKVTNLTLQYTGSTTALITVEQKKDHEVIFEQTINPGEEFSFLGTDKGTLGTEIKIYINNVENTKIHTSCSQPIAPGMTFGNFLIIAGASKNGGPLCPVEPQPEPEPEPNCAECDGKVTTLTLRYDGTSSAQIQVVQKNGDTIFNSAVSPGNNFSFQGTDKDTLGTEIRVFINIIENTKIHTSCSQPIAPGMTFGDFTILAGESKNGGPLCPNGNFEISSMSIQGEPESCVDPEDPNAPLDDDYKSYLIEFEDGSIVSGTSESNDAYVLVDGYDLKLHVSCSDEFFGPDKTEGTVDDGFGEKEDPTAADGHPRVVSYQIWKYKLDNKKDTCELDKVCSGVPLPSEDDEDACYPDDCAECDGKVTNLTLQYTGSTSALITVEQKKDHEVIFEQTINPGEEFSFQGTDKGTLGTEVKIYINNVENTKIHTSCSQPIAPGMTFGDFTILAGASKNGGPLCPIPGFNPCPPTNCTTDQDCSSNQICNVCTGQCVDENNNDFDNDSIPNYNLTCDQSCQDNFSCTPQSDDGFTFALLGKQDNCNGTYTYQFKVTNNNNKALSYVAFGLPCLNNGHTCAECDGKVTNLTLQYNGTSSATIKVVQKNGDTIFEDIVAPHGEFSFQGTDKGTLGTEVKIYINNVENTKIHTSCSQPIAPGMTFGDFTILAGESKNGGSLCPLDACLVPIWPADSSTYHGEVNDYEVENPADKPFYSIKYETIGEGIKNGQFDIFTSVLDQDPDDYPIEIEAKAGKKKGQVILDCQGTDCSCTNNCTNTIVDNCICIPNSNQLDTDNDGVGDVCDNCPDDYNPDQTDTNNNSIGDACEIEDELCGQLLVFKEDTFNIIGRVNLTANIWKFYNLTLEQLSDPANTIDLYSCSPIIYDYIAALTSGQAACVPWGNSSTSTMSVAALPETTTSNIALSSSGSSKSFITRTLEKVNSYFDASAQPVQPLYVQPEANKQKIIQEKNEELIQTKKEALLPIWILVFSNLILIIVAAVVMSRK